jgi:predicted DNA-binding transcriptional regulator YafY
LVHRSGWWYLVAFCHLRQALRTFRVDRIQDLALLDELFEMPDDFDVHDHLAVTFEDQAVVRGRLLFVPQATFLANVNNLPGWESSQENPDGSLEVVLTAPDLQWLASLVLSFTTWVTVLEPLELRNMVRDWALATAELYQ